jgi:hypothetical protein
VRESQREILWLEIEDSEQQLIPLLRDLRTQVENIIVSESDKECRYDFYCRNCSPYP